MENTGRWWHEVLTPSLSCSRNFLGAEVRARYPGELLMGVMGRVCYSVEDRNKACSGVLLFCSRAAAAVFELPCLLHCLTVALSSVLQECAEG